MVLSGSQQGIDLAAKLVVDAGTTLAVESPAYLAALQVFRFYGARFEIIDRSAPGRRLGRGAAFHGLRHPDLPEPKRPLLDRRRARGHGRRLPGQRRDPVRGRSLSRPGLRALRPHAGLRRPDGRLVDLPGLVLQDRRAGPAPGLPDRLARPVPAAGPAEAGGRPAHQPAQPVDGAAISERSGPRRADGPGRRPLSPQARRLRRRPDPASGQHGLVVAAAGRVVLLADPGRRRRRRGPAEAAVERGVLFTPGSHFLAEGGASPTIRLNFSLAEPEAAERGLAILAELLREKT
jgi:2-aminoadipate transaminase